MLTDAERQAAADAILAAEDARVPCVQPSRRWQGMELEDAYDLQRRRAEARIARGAGVMGRKIGLTSHAMQPGGRMTEPDDGAILDDAFFEDGAAIPAARFIRPRIETERAFVMGADPSGPGARVAGVLRATEFVQSALEIIDARTEAPRAIADNAAFGAIVPGGRPVRPFDVDLRRCGAILSQNGVIEDTGLGAAIMGRPAAGLAWLVNTPAPPGGGLTKGGAAPGGSFTRAPDIRAGDVIHADYGQLGGIGVRIA